MKSWSVGAFALGLFVGLGGTGTQAQQPASETNPPLPRPPQSRPQPAARAGQPRYQRVAFQNAPAAPMPVVPPPPSVPEPPGVPPVPSAPITPSGVTPVIPTPAAGSEMEGRSEPLRSNTDLSLPRSEREGGGGEPTEAAAAADSATSSEEPAEEPPAKDPTKLLTNFLGMEESPVKIYGWLQNSYTYNANGRGVTGQNFGVTPNNLANQWQGNQYYIIVENPLEQGEKVNFGFRVDNLFGNDWQFNHEHGMFDTSAKANHFNGYDPAQIYGEVHIPAILSKGGTDIKGGRFYTILGYEVVPATGRPLLSVPMMFNYGQPFTHLGAIATTHVTDRVNWYNGVVNGSDRWVDQNYKWNYLGGFTWTTKNGKGTLAVSYITGPNNYPRFVPTNKPVYPEGISPPGFLTGRYNILYGGSFRTTFTTVFTYKWSDTFTQVIETDESIEKNVPGFGAGGTPNDAEWYSFGNWFLWQFWKKDDRDIMTGVWRSEVFRDNNGVRTGFAANFFEVTLGAIIKPKPYIWVRPEFRYDWCQGATPYTDGTRSSQFTIGVDAILLY